MPISEIQSEVLRRIAANRSSESYLAGATVIHWLMRAPTIHRAVVTVNRRQLKIEWVQDSAFRFFPVQEDERFGYRLHDADAAINKVLALAGRDEVRD